MNTLGIYNNDNLSMNDMLFDAFDDTGTDVLGASDSILHAVRPSFKSFSIHTTRL